MPRTVLDDVGITMRTIKVKKKIRTGWKVKWENGIDKLKQKHRYGYELVCGEQQ